MWQICIGYVWVCSFMHITIPSSFAVEMFKYIYIDICSDFQCILTRKLKIETSSKPLQHTPKAMFHRLMRCNVYNYASTCMFPFRKNRFSMPRSHYFFLKNSLCYLIFALVCNIFGLGERTFSQWNVFHDPGWPGSSCVQGNSLHTCLSRCDLSFYIHYIISIETVRLNCKGI